MTVPPKIRNLNECSCRDRCECKPNRLEVLHWTRRLIEAEDNRREAERTYQQVLMRLRGALGSGD